MWGGVILHVRVTFHSSNGGKSLFTYDVEESLFTFGEESLLTFCRGVTLHIWCGEESLSCGEESHFTFDVRRSLSSHLMWRGATLHI
jgi:hypothetical protein